jgi:starch phosphorylase
VRHRFVFIPDYDIAVARFMYHGCDVWLNNPRRPQEACGTSGMKAALNGALNASIRDGWWDEWSDGENGWDILSVDDDPDAHRRDEREATSLFGLLEQEITPLFYDTSKSREGLPIDWIDMMRHNWASLGPKVTASRMVRDYVTALYEPAATGSIAATKSDAAGARALAAWKQTVRRAWPNVRIAGLDTDTTPGRAGDTRNVRCTVELGGLTPADVSVQVLHGPIDLQGELLKTPHCYELTPGADGVWSGDYVVGQSGAYGLTARILPTHAMLANPFELGLVGWADRRASVRS